MTRRRVVITGLGMLSPLGTDVASTWEGILAGRCGIRRIDHFDTENFSTKFAGLVPDFAMDEYLSGKEARKMAVFVQTALALFVQMALPVQAALSVQTVLSVPMAVFLAILV